MSTWLWQEDLDWMYDFLTSHSIKSKRNYHIENEKGWRIILSNSGFQDIRVLTKSVTYTYDSVDFWWKEMMDYGWPVNGENREVITDDIKKEAFKLIKNRLGEGGGVPFIRDAIFVTATYPDQTP